MTAMIVGVTELPDPVWSAESSEEAKVAPVVSFLCLQHAAAECRDFNDCVDARGFVEL